MSTDSGPPSARWRPGVVAADWTDSERVHAALLDALTRDLVETEAAQLEMDARPRKGMAEILENEQRIEQEQSQAARRELSGFAHALRDARVRSGEHGRDEVPYDAANPEQDEQADLLIHYLVRPGYADVRTEERASGQHVYHLRVDWERLRDLAGDAGQSLRL